MGIVLLLGIILSRTSAHPPNQQWLIDSNRSALVVIDVQDDFLTKLPLDQRSSLVDRMGWLIKVALYLDIPLLVTAEDLAHNPPVVPELTALLPQGQKVFDKHVWNLYGQPDIRDAVDAFGRDTFILIGLETDVCVAQSALGLQAGGYNVVVVDDATGSPPPHHEAGVRRLRDAQITLQTTKGVYYELVRDIPTSHRVMTHIKTNYSYPTLGCATDYTI